MCQRLSKCKCDETFYLRPHPSTLPHRHPATFWFLLHINYQHLTVFQRLSEYKHDVNFCLGIHPCTPPPPPPPPPPSPFDKQLLFDFCFTKNGVPKLNPEKVTGKSIRTETSTWPKVPISEESHCRGSKFRNKSKKEGQKAWLKSSFLSLMKLD